MSRLKHFTVNPDARDTRQSIKSFLHRVPVVLILDVEMLPERIVMFIVPAKPNQMRTLPHANQRPLDLIHRQVEALM